MDALVDVARFAIGLMMAVAALAPAALTPGAFLSLVLLGGWLLLKRRRQVWNGLVRGGALLVDLTIGLVLVPEYAWTTSRRGRGLPAPALALVSSRLAEQVLDAAAGAYERHPRVEATGRPPLAWALVALTASGLVAWVLRSAPSPELLAGAESVWGLWLDLRAWVAAG